MVTYPMNLAEVRDRLETLVHRRAAGGLLPYEHVEYQRLTMVEIQLLGV